jgi:hypothetical protein
MSHLIYGQRKFMKSFVTDLLIEKALKRAVVLAALMVVFGVLGNTQISAQKLPPVSRTQAMLRQTIRDFADAIEAEDFTGLHAKASTDFQVTFTTERLKEVFQSFIDKKDLILPSLRSIKMKRAQFIRGPLIRTEKGYKILVADGAFATLPYKTIFEIEYEWTGKKWELLAIKVKM